MSERLTLKAERGYSKPESKKNFFDKLKEKAVELKNDPLMDGITEIHRNITICESLNADCSEIVSSLKRLDDLMSSMMDLTVQERDRSREGLPRGLSGAATEGAERILAKLKAIISERQKSIDDLARLVAGAEEDGSNPTQTTSSSPEDVNMVDHVGKSQEPVSEQPMKSMAQKGSQDMFKQESAGVALGFAEKTILCSVALFAGCFLFSVVASGFSKKEITHASPSALNVAISVESTVKGISEGLIDSNIGDFKSPSFREKTDSGEILTFNGIREEACALTVAKLKKIPNVKISVNKKEANSCVSDFNSIKVDVKRSDSIR